MKRLKWFGWAFAAIMTSASFTACTNETEEVYAQSNEIKLTSAITPASRVANQDLQSTQIVTGQEIGVTTTDAKSDQNNVKWIAQTDGSLTNQGSPLYWGNTDVMITAYHPFNSNWGTGTAQTFSVNTDQSENENYLNSDLLWVNTTASKSTNPIELKFAHKLSKIMVGLQHEETETEVTNAIISICGTKTTATFDLSSGTITASGSVADIKAAQAASAAAIIIPQTVNAGTKFIKVEFNGKTFYYTLSGNKTFEAGKAYDFTLTLKEKGTELTLTSPESEGNITDWDSENNSTTGDANEDETGNTPATGTVVIENKELSEELLRILSSEKVSINDTGYAIISQEDADDVTNLGLGNPNITSLTGIECFKNLTHLYCNELTLSSCDLSKNIALELFEARSASFTSLDFRNINIESIELIECSISTSLDVSGCPELSILSLRSAEINKTSLIIPDEVKAGIEELYYDCTSLEFDFEKFPSLSVLFISNLKESTLDGYIPESTMSNLIAFSCSDSQLEKLNLSKFPKLIYLNCNSNKISTLETSATPNLRRLFCYNNHISSLDISENTVLEEWQCGNQTDENESSTQIDITLTAAQKELFEQNNWANNNNIKLNIK